MSKEIKYSYGLTKDNEAVHISEVNRFNKYFCITCGDVFVPVLSKNKRQYFRHKKLGDNHKEIHKKNYYKNGSGGESDIHKECKLIFEEWLKTDHKKYDIVCICCSQVINDRNFKYYETQKETPFKNYFIDISTLNENGDILNAFEIINTSPTPFDKKIELFKNNILLYETECDYLIQVYRNGHSVNKYMRLKSYCDKCMNNLIKQSYHTITRPKYNCNNVPKNKYIIGDILREDDNYISFNIIHTGIPKSLYIYKNNLEFLDDGIVFNMDTSYHSYFYSTLYNDIKNIDSLLIYQEQSIPICNNFDNYDFERKDVVQIILIYDIIKKYSFFTFRLSS